MLDRRSFLLAAAFGTVGFPVLAQAPASDEPVAIANAIYTRAAAGKGDSGGDFISANKAAKAKYLSKALITLWDRANAHTRKGDVGPVDFDPVTNSQDPDVASFKVTAEASQIDAATIAVAFSGHIVNGEKPPEQVVRYAFVREAGQWKIDDIKGSADATPWSLRKILTESLKSR